MSTYEMTGHAWNFVIFSLKPIRTSSLPMFKILSICSWASSFISCRSETFLVVAVFFNSSSIFGPFFLFTMLDWAFKYQFTSSTYPTLHLPPIGFYYNQFFAWPIFQLAHYSNSLVRPLFYLSLRFLLSTAQSF